MTAPDQPVPDRTVPVGDEQRWVAFVQGADRTGTLTALAGVFSTRGVSFDSLSTGSDVADGVGPIVVTFTASERRSRLLVRTVARLSGVRAVDLRAAADPTVRAVAVLAPGDWPGIALPDGVRCSGDPSGDRPVLVDGPLAQVEQVVAAAHRGGARSVTSVVLPHPGPDPARR
ncbi:MAG TPA: hypothetical protein VGC67_10155 [Cellulomonas sp.]